MATNPWSALADRAVTHAQDWLQWATDRWQRSQGQVPGGPPRVGNVSPARPEDIAAMTPAPPAAPTPPAGTDTAPPPGAAPASPPAAAAPSPDDKPPAALDQFRGQQRDVQAAILQAEQDIRDEASGKEGAVDRAVAARQALPGLRSLLTTITSQIAAEENRLRDDAKAKETEKDKPKNGDTRIGRDTYTLPNGQTVRGVYTERYENGVWKYVEGSARREEGFAGQPQGTGTAGTVLTDGRGAYWLVDPYSGETKPLNGPAAAVKTITDPDGSVWTQTPDGGKGQKLFDSLPGTYTTQDGRVIGYDRRTGQQVFNVDTQTQEGRALADRLQRATVEAAERANLPQFGSAVAQYQAEAQRRQGLAEQELQRLTDLQRSAQITPDQAKAQFERWMQLNVEGPLSGYRAAAEAERRQQEQENLTRQRAEEARVEGLNRERDRLAYEAGEAGRREGIEIGQRTRAPEYIRDLGGLAASFSAGVGQPGAGASGMSKTPFQFSPGSFDVANYRKAVPNLNELADAAVNRLLSRVQPATARDVNVPVSPLPTGPELRGLMDTVRYSGPLSAAPQAEVPEIPALDIGGGRARTVYSNNRWVDWDIPAA